MKVKFLLFLILSILTAFMIGCGNSSVFKKLDEGTTKNTPTNEPSVSTEREQEIEDISITPAALDVEKENDSIISTNTSEPFVGNMDLDSDTEDFFYGTWKIDKLLGFANSYNDASEYPNGQKVIGDEIIINKDFFSSKGLENYNNYQAELENPRYVIRAIYYNNDSFYASFKTDLQGLNKNDEVKYILVTNSDSGLSIPISFLDVNNERLILVLDATDFELKKVTD